jgi:hypothetical protein
MQSNCDTKQLRGCRSVLTVCFILLVCGCAKNFRLSDTDSPQYRHLYIVYTFDDSHTLTDTYTHTHTHTNTQTHTQTHFRLKPFSFLLPISVLCLHCKLKRACCDSFRQLIKVIISLDPWTRALSVSGRDGWSVEYRPRCIFEYCTTLVSRYTFHCRKSSTHKNIIWYCTNNNLMNILYFKDSSHES